MNSGRTVLRSFVSIALVAISLLAGCRDTDRARPDDTLSVTLGVSKENLSALAYVARDQGIFEANGLDVEFLEYSSSQLAHEALLAGAVDAALCADTPIVIGALEGDMVTIIATISSDINDIKIVARSDAGIQETSDLSGKRIGTRDGTAAHFFLHSFLIKNGMSEADVDVRFDSFEGVTAALISGDLDAVALRQPFIGELQEQLGERFVLFEEHGLYGKTMNLCLCPEVDLEDGVSERLIASFIEAEEYVLASDIEQVKDDVAAALGIAPTDLCNCMFVEGAVGLRQSLVLTLEDQARWAVDSSVVAEPVLFDSLAMLDPGPLDAIDADRVTILRGGSATA
ncbi:MAG: NrtA/SsuA/CpmA family ABC transporter substrate-binding protein, partial [Coriobacteriia bacterium]|nr:NrtA/SsuA/CpmA family ABC transporter substrate-binding protein [Coriobacteriia bacterium]